jgi:hypothetical protein
MIGPKKIVCIEYKQKKFPSKESPELLIRNGFIAIPYPIFSANGDPDPRF